MVEMHLQVVAKLFFFFFFKVKLSTLISKLGESHQHLASPPPPHTMTNLAF